MAETSLSLLDRLQDSPRNEAWARLVEIYTPLMRAWLKRQGLADADADDLVQEVLTVVLRRVPEFEHNGRTGAFRTWLRTITANCLRDFWRSKRMRPLAGGEGAFDQWLQELADSDSGLSRLWDQEHDQHVTRKLLEMLQPRFTPNTWQAFCRVAIDAQKPEAVAQELGLTVNAVFVAKSRVLAALRQEAAGLIDL